MVQIWTNNHRDYHRQLAGMKWRANMGNALLQMFLMYQVSSIFQGQIAARLPFKPFEFVTSMTHRGLEGTDMSEVSVFCIYALAQAAFRGSVSKLLGNPEGPRMPMDY